MDWLMQLLTDADSVGHILLVYSMVIALGMALGRIKVFGISLGVTFVLFVALGVSYAGVTVNGTVLNFLRDFGLILFVFFIGLHDLMDQTAFFPFFSLIVFFCPTEMLTFFVLSFGAFFFAAAGEDGIDTPRSNAAVIT